MFRIHQTSQEYILKAHQFGLTTKSTLRNLRIGPGGRRIACRDIENLLTLHGYYPRRVYSEHEVNVRFVVMTHLQYPHFSSRGIEQMMRVRGFALAKGHKVESILEYDSWIRSVLAVGPMHHEWKKAVVSGHQLCYKAHEINWLAMSEMKFDIISHYDDIENIIKDSLAIFSGPPYVLLPRGQELHGNKVAEEFVLSSANLGVSVETLIGEMRVLGFNIYYMVPELLVDFIRSGITRNSQSDGGGNGEDANDVDCCEEGDEVDEGGDADDTDYGAMEESGRLTDSDVRMRFS